MCAQSSCKGSSSERGSASVLLDPPEVPVGPARPTPPSEPWTASAQKTQSARQRFFQAAAGEGAPAKLDGGGGARAGKTAAEGNCNNNNKRPFSIRPAERR